MPEDLSFVYPGRLWLLIAVALIAAALVLTAVRRRSAGTAYADSSLLGAVAPHRPGWRRLPGQLLVLLALVALTFAWAEPEALAETSRERSVVVVIMDTSDSMLADDVSPDRLTAAKNAASDFVDELPEQVDVALVSFNRAAFLDARPTSDHDAVSATIQGLGHDGGTAQGDAILTALAAIEQGLPAVEPGEVPAARIVMLTDGNTTLGTPVEVAVSKAQELAVPVSTISFGTEEGIVRTPTRDIPVPVMNDSLRSTAEETGGQAYAAQDLDALDEVYADIGSQLEQETAREPLSAAVMGIALALLLAGAVPAVLLLRRVP